MTIRGIGYDKCKNCGLCYEICPMDVFGMFAGKVYLKYPEDCQSCNLCNVVCVFDACLVDGLRYRPLPGKSSALETQKEARNESEGN